eukprot:m.203017 g.203017  ORF g.203017 m.203017 type:complete len:91 (-) comp14985_c0_seq1:1259-1531(-)
MECQFANIKASINHPSPCDLTIQMIVIEPAGYSISISNSNLLVYRYSACSDRAKRTMKLQHRPQQLERMRLAVFDDRERSSRRLQTMLSS